MTAVAFTQPAGDPSEAIRTQLQQVVMAHSANAPRSLQRAIGPSEVGTACARRLAYKILEQPEVNTTADPWASISGTAIHAWLADAFTATDPDRYLVETRVQVTPSLGGSVDLYDRATKTVVDHKMSGPTGMTRYRAEGPKDQQVIQVNIYGLGLELAGHQVERVALAFYPLGGNLGGVHVWTAPYDRMVALNALQRLDDIRRMVVELDVEDHPERWALVPTDTSRLCRYCPFFKYRSRDLAAGCPGDSK